MKIKLICSSLGCNCEKPVDYCKECSHANWVINKDLTFNPRFGPSSEKDIDWNEFEKWHERFEKIDIDETSFVIHNH